MGPELPSTDWMKYLDLVDDEIKDQLNRAIIWAFEKQDFDRFRSWVEPKVEGDSKLEKDVEKVRIELYLDPVEKVGRMYSALELYTEHAEVTRINIDEFVRRGAEPTQLQPLKALYEPLIARRDFFENHIKTLEGYFKKIAEAGRKVFGESQLEGLIGDDESMYSVVAGRGDEVMMEVFPTKKDFLDFQKIIEEAFKSTLGLAEEFHSDTEDGRAEIDAKRTLNDLLKAHTEYQVQKLYTNPLKHLTLNELLEKSRDEVVAWRECEIDIMKQRMTEQGFDMEKSMYDNMKTGLMELAENLSKDKIPLVLEHYLNLVVAEPDLYQSFSMLRTDAMKGRLNEEMGNFREYLQLYREVAEAYEVELPGFDEKVDGCIEHIRKNLEAAHSRATQYIF